ncbi:hypothetical protein H7169_03765 [Candidatus Gracilibacteria bacterium]|nr:hypothetical protein [Candidatus Gracilibacteria bacterium]
MTSSREQLRSYINWSIASALLVALIAIGEFLGGVLDIYGRSEMISIYPGRSSSTLGNPNYVAGYLLPFVPIMLEGVWRNQKTLIKNEGMNYLLRLTIILCLLLAVVVTGSYIALLLLAILVISYSVSYLLYGYSKVKQIITLATIVAIFILGSLILLDPVKLLSLQSRFILMKESMLVIFAHPVNILIGFGPDSLLTQFSIARSTLVDAYFPQNMLIDSSHNIFIDILFQYGIFPVYLILRFIIINYEKLTTPTGLSIVLLLTFLTFNVFVISHIIVLILLFVFTFKD